MVQARGEVGQADRVDVEHGCRSDSRRRGRDAGHKQSGCAAHRVAPQQIGLDASRFRSRHALLEQRPIPARLSISTAATARSSARRRAGRPEWRRDRRRPIFSRARASTMSSAIARGGSSSTRPRTRRAPSVGEPRLPLARNGGHIRRRGTRRSRTRPLRRRLRGPPKLASRATAERRHRRLICRMCSGVVPQQPATSRTLLEDETPRVRRHVFREQR